MVAATRQWWDLSDYGLRVRSGDGAELSSLMYSCGMYDFSGEFALKSGYLRRAAFPGHDDRHPERDGRTWSPRLDRLGNSVVGSSSVSRWSGKLSQLR